MGISRKDLEEWCDLEEDQTKVLGLITHFDLRKRINDIDEKELEEWVNREIDDIIEYGSMMWGRKKEKKRCGENMSFFHALLHHFNLKRQRVS